MAYAQLAKQPSTAAAPSASGPAVRPMRVALFSTLYPSAARPGHGIFVETRLRELLRSEAVQARVVAPVPWFPSTAERWGDYAKMARTPRHEVRHGVEVAHPRYVLPPRIGQTIAPFSLALGALGSMRAMRRAGFDFDLIDAHYFYPDGVAAAMLSRLLGRPFVITARGSDLNVLGRDPVARRLMQWAARQAAACIGVSNALADILRGWGVPPERVHVVRNGVNLQQFKPWPSVEARQRLGLGGEPLVLSVGNLVPVKGHDLTIDAFALLGSRLPGLRLVIVGRGPEREALQALARRRGVADRVHFAGAVPHEDLSWWYSAADVFALASHSEGWPNVLLESMACGTPVIAPDVGGCPEVIGPGVAGKVLPQRDAVSMAAAMEAAWLQAFDRHGVRRYAEQFSWDATTAAQVGIFKRVIASPAAAGHRARIVR